jgi:hypothetical protein
MMKTLSGRNKWRAASLILAILSIVANLEWVSLPFSFYGLRGRSGVLYGDYTLLQTFYFHPSGRVWWVLFVVQVFLVLLIALDAPALGSGWRLVIFGLPSLGLLLLDVYIAQRWDALGLWSMSAVGAIAVFLLAGSAVCYTKLH